MRCGCCVSVLFVHALHLKSQRDLIVDKGAGLQSGLEDAVLVDV